MAIVLFMRRPCLRHHKLGSGLRFSIGMYHASCYICSQARNRTFNKAICGPILAEAESHLLSNYAELLGRRLENATWKNSQPAAVEVRRVGVSEGLGSAKQGDELQRLCEIGQLDRDLDLLPLLEHEGTTPPLKLYRFLFKACAERKALVWARQLHAHLVQHGLESARVIGECVVSTFVKCGGLEDALQAFCKLSHRTVFSWTAIISGYAASGHVHEALRMYERMKEEDVQPNAYTFVSVLKACSTIADLTEGRRMHREILKYRCESELFVGNCLVDMYGKCGSIMDAQHVFDELSQRDVVSWNAILAAYAQDTQGDRAINLYQEMREAGVSPNARTFSSVLQACGMLAEKEVAFTQGEMIPKVSSLAKGKWIHADAWVKGLHSDVFVSSTLISMYGKCNSIADAESVFNSLWDPNVVSWNSLLAAYVEQGKEEKALELFVQMNEEGMSPNNRTIVSALQSCGMLAERESLDGQDSTLLSLQKGKALHFAALRKGCTSDVFVCSSLVSMYGKCGSMMDAQYVFDGFCHRNVVTWNGMLAAYVQQGQSDKVLQLYGQLQEEGVSPNQLTLVSALQACGMLAQVEDTVMAGHSTKLYFLEKCKVIHADARRKGFDSNDIVGNTLISMYGKCGGTVDAQLVFDQMSQRGQVTWNAMLASYVEKEQPQKALQLYEKMQEEGLSPNERTFVGATQACSLLAEMEEDATTDAGCWKAKSLKLLKELCAHTWRRGYDFDVFVCNGFLSAFGKCGSIVDAQNVFDWLPQRDVVSWNAIIATYVEQAQSDKALAMFEQMLEEGVTSNERTFISMLQACCVHAEQEQGLMVHGQLLKAKSLEMGRTLHFDARSKGFDSDAHVGSKLVSLYAKCGSILDAQKFFDGASLHGVVLCNAMLMALVGQGHPENALQLYQDLLEDGLRPNELTIVWIIKACTDTGSLAMLRHVHHIVGTTNNLCPFVASALVCGYGRCSSMVDAQCVFDEVPQPDTVLWTTLIAGYAQQADYAASLHAFKEMQLAGVKPDQVTFLSLLAACCHTGLVYIGVEYFESMSKRHGITPRIEHYVSMVDLLGRAGCFRGITALLASMPMQPNLALWLCLLGACRKYTNVAMGECVFDCAVRLEPNHAATYILMASIYEDAHFLDLAKQVRQRGHTCKEPGQSWIELYGKVHTFLVGDRNHQQDKFLHKFNKLLSHPH